ncbi:MAG: DNA alkylation repair protein [Rhodospirillaceae bacterium]|nr:DNA alkylation repair protein [Rhodospirillaceae bacterium]MBT6204194.1 DNA alkylation repair protein [Rhodospirillaceae bacterium]MBT6512550.1 DNA alkylation repair protein [Rhodospirillaceae bacterium]MBT7614282.1 DNA alkylation repair protein [Rhodospirillaceae bacterium]MBT7648388.1 DNA alkylation repair protein [Rhodospirillaceae bacterium]
MAFELKLWFDRAFFEEIAGALADEHRGFDRKGFVKAALKDLDSLSLKERLSRTAMLCGQFLPDDYSSALAVVEAVAPRYEGQFRALFAPEFVSLFGRDDRSRSLDALRRLTRFGSAEFAIRHFILDDPQETLDVMTRWAGDDDHHVRRLASEGSRPRLPWSFKLDHLIEDPSRAFPILEPLRGDPELYVRKSVANHLNDIGKDHAGTMLDLVDGWDRRDPNTAKHACRSLIKAGDRRALALFGFGKQPEIEVEGLTVSPSQVVWEGTVEITFDLISKAKAGQQLALDYVVHYMKAHGETAPKVFKLKELELAVGESLAIRTRRSLQERTTRRHYPGRHEIEIQINGVRCATAPFELLAPDS